LNAPTANQQRLPLLIAMPPVGLYGLAVCFRLLGLIEQLATAAWLRPHFSVGGREGPEIHPAILETAATLALTRDARFDSTLFQHHTERLLGRARLDSSAL
jgi:hypothetical protein